MRGRLGLCPCGYGDIIAAGTNPVALSPRDGHDQRLHEVDGAFRW